MSIKILLADDSQEKLKYIKETLDANIKYDVLDISNSYNSTTKAIKKNNYNLVILDMSMPTFDAVDGQISATPRPLAGKDVMSKLHYRGNKTPIIILTQFDVFGRLNDVVGIEDLKSDLKSSFPDNFKGCVFYDPQGSTWISELLSIVNEVLKVE
ncbi:response regulator [Aeromonas veronii]|uniref:response regulator n=1 Tax=Aeromonas veronii TaxID=654 RepID=UPI0031FBE2FF